MPTIRITNDVMDLIRANVSWGATLRQEGTRLPDGRWDIPVDEDTYQHILDNQLPGESCSDAILRLASFVKGGHN